MITSYFEEVNVSTIVALYPDNMTLTFTIYTPCSFGTFRVRSSEVVVRLRLLWPLMIFVFNYIIYSDMVCSLLLQTMSFLMPFLISETY